MTGPESQDGFCRRPGHPGARTFVVMKQVRRTAIAVTAELASLRLGENEFRQGGYPDDHDDATQEHRR